MGFKTKLKNRANQNFDKLIVDPSFIKQTPPKPAPSKKKVFVPIFSAAMSLSLVASIATILIVRNNIQVSKENAQIKELETQYIMPYDGKYGIYLSYWQITDMYTSKQKGAIKHNYYLLHVETGEVTRAGWIEYISTETQTVETPSLNFRGQPNVDRYGRQIYDTHDETYYHTQVHFEDNSIEDIKLSADSLSVSLGDGWSDMSSSIWGKMPFIGVYKSNDGGVFEFKKDATLFDKNNEESIDCAITDYSKAKIIIRCTEETKKNKLLTSNIEVTLVDGKYQFIKDGITYYQQSE